MSRSRSKTPKYQSKRYESAGESYIDHHGKSRKDTFASIYETMLISPAWQKLTYKQRVLYLVCKAQITGKRKPKQDYKEFDLYQQEECFYLNLYTISKAYHMYREDDSRFYKDMKVLEQYGFIKKLASGRHSQCNNVYMLVSAWQDIE